LRSGAPVVISDAMPERSGPRPRIRVDVAPGGPSGEERETASDGDLTGQLLISMPGMRDPRFERAVVFVCEHSEKGTMGLVINRPSEDVTFAELADHLDVELPDEPGEVDVHVGGPVEPGRGFVLHSADYDRSGATLRVGGRFGMTATIDVLREIAEGAGPDRALLALGYAGWSPGQLEGEIAANCWLTADATLEIVFDREPAEKWGAALGTLGVDPTGLSAEAGRA
jgi:putative transcriptional regulator